jgi:hypothetical protein
MSTSDVRTSAGSKLLVCAALPAAYTIAAFQALPWVEVAEITDLGEFGREYNQVTHSPLSSRRIVKRKGSFNEGSMTVPMARAASDEGQALMSAASLSDDSYSYCIELQDGSRFYFSAQCMSYKTNVGGVDSITARTAQLEVDNAILEAAAVSFALSYSAPADQGSIVGQAQQAVLRGGAGKPVFAQAGTGFEFVKWSDDVADNPRSDTNVQAAITVVAEFKAA